MHFGENKPFLLLPCQKLKKFDLKVVKIFFFSKINNLPKIDQFDRFLGAKNVLLAILCDF
jgi:hypothetical protein